MSDRADALIKATLDEGIGKLLGGGIGLVRRGVRNLVTRGRDAIKREISDFKSGVRGEPTSAAPAATPGGYDDYSADSSGLGAVAKRVAASASPSDTYTPYYDLGSIAGHMAGAASPTASNWRAATGTTGRPAAAAPAASRPKKAEVVQTRGSETSFRPRTRTRLGQRSGRAGDPFQHSQDAVDNATAAAKAREAAPAAAPKVEPVTATKVEPATASSDDLMAQLAGSLANIQASKAADAVQSVTANVQAKIADKTGVPETPVKVKEPETPAAAGAADTTPAEPVKKKGGNRRTKAVEPEKAVEQPRVTASTLDSILGTTNAQSFSDEPTSFGQIVPDAPAVHAEVPAGAGSAVVTTGAQPKVDLQKAVAAAETPTAFQSATKGTASGTAAKASEPEEPEPTLHDLGLGHLSHLYAELSDDDDSKHAEGLRKIYDNARVKWDAARADRRIKAELLANADSGRTTTVDPEVEARRKEAEAFKQQHQGVIKGRGKTTRIEFDGAAPPPRGGTGTTPRVPAAPKPTATAQALAAAQAVSSARTNTPEAPAASAGSPAVIRRAAPAPPPATAGTVKPPGSAANEPSEPAPKITTSATGGAPATVVAMGASERKKAEKRAAAEAEKREAEAKAKAVAGNVGTSLADKLAQAAAAPEGKKKDQPLTPSVPSSSSSAGVAPSSSSSAGGEDDELEDWSTPTVAASDRAAVLAAAAAKRAAENAPRGGASTRGSAPEAPARTGLVQTSFFVGDQVEHPTFGRGTIRGFSASGENPVLQVHFDSNPNEPKKILSKMPNGAAHPLKVVKQNTSAKRVAVTAGSVPYSDDPEEVAKRAAEYELDLTKKANAGNIKAKKLLKALRSEKENAARSGVDNVGSITSASKAILDPNKVPEEDKEQAQLNASAEQDKEENEFKSTLSTGRSSGRGSSTTSSGRGRTSTSRSGEFGVGFQLPTDLSWERPPREAFKPASEVLPTAQKQAQSEIETRRKNNPSQPVVLTSKELLNQELERRKNNPDKIDLNKVLSGIGDIEVDDDFDYEADGDKIDVGGPFGWGDSPIERGEAAERAKKAKQNAKPTFASKEDEEKYNREQAKAQERAQILSGRYFRAQSAADAARTPEQVAALSPEEQKRHSDGGLRYRAIRPPSVFSGVTRSGMETYKDKTTRHGLFRENPNPTGKTQAEIEQDKWTKIADYDPTGAYDGVLDDLVISKARDKAETERDDRVKRLEKIFKGDPKKGETPITAEMLGRAAKNIELAKARGLNIDDLVKRAQARQAARTSADSKKEKETEKSTTKSIPKGFFTV